MLGFSLSTTTSRLLATAHKSSNKSGTPFPLSSGARLAKPSRLSSATKGRHANVDQLLHLRTVFDTVPWPQAPDANAVRAVAASGREVRRIRAEALPQMRGGLRALYRTLELPGANPLKAAHAALDAAVLAAYGFTPKADLLAQLLTLNREVAARLTRADPVTAPGLPPTFPRPELLITGDCIRPMTTH